MMSLSKNKFALKVLTILSFIIPLFQPVQHIHGQEKANVTVTTTILEDMVKNIAGDQVEIELIMPAGSDPHIYTAESKDLEKISQADLVLFHGLHLEGKLAQVLEEYGHAVSKDFDPNDLRVMDDEDDGMAVDPHFWFDIELYKQATVTASQILQEELPDLAESFEANTQAYLEELDELAQWTEETISVLSVEQRKLVTPHDAFSYFANRYDFEVYAPQGVTTDSEVSNQDLKENIDFIVENKIPAIFLDSTSNPDALMKLQEAVEQEGQDLILVTGENQELFSDSLAAPGQEGDTYITMYKHNVQLIVDYLNK